MVGAYLLGLLTLPTGWALAQATAWAFSRNIGFNQRQDTDANTSCNVCTHRPAFDIGERTMLMAWLIDQRHRWLWATRKWHRDAWASHRLNRSAKR